MDMLIEIVEAAVAQNIFVAIFLAYLGGALTTFTPCVYPMIPVTLAITLGTAVSDEKEKWKKLSSPFFYCLGISAAYAALGMFAASTGTLFGQWAANPWLYIILAVIFVMLGLNMLNVIKLPTLQFQYKANRNSKISLFLFGALTGVIFSPCTAPIMGVFLLYASTQSLAGGGLLLFCYAAGFSTLLLLMAWASLYAKDKVPKSGQWLERTKWAIVAVCFLMAIYFLFKAAAFFSGRVLLV